MPSKRFGSELAIFGGGLGGVLESEGLECEGLAFDANMELKRVVV